MSVDTIDNRPSLTPGSADATVVDSADKTNILVNMVEHDYTGSQSVTSPRPSVEEMDFISFYRLRENPFADCVNPEYFYRTEPHAEAIQRMLLTVQHDLSLGMVTGPSGSGKTLISQILLQKLDRTRYEPVLILVSPGLSKTGLLREILSELNLALPVGISRMQDLLKLLHNHVIDLYHQGRRLVIMIDECHFLSSDNLHILRTISNIEIPECKLVTCLLFGEEKFRKRLEHPTYDSLRTRMYMRCELDSMSLEDCRQYVKFRLMVAGSVTEVFDESAVQSLHLNSGGGCRSLSKLCMLSLLEGALREKAVVDAATVEACAERA